MISRGIPIIPRKRDRTSSVWEALGGSTLVKKTLLSFVCPQFPRTLSISTMVHFASCWASSSTLHIDMTKEVATVEDDDLDRFILFPIKHSDVCYFSISVFNRLTHIPMKVWELYVLFIIFEQYPYKVGQLQTCTHLLLDGWRSRCYSRHSGLEIFVIV